MPRVKSVPRRRMPVRIGPAEAARRLGVEVQTVYNYISDGRLRAYRLGDKTIRLNLDDVENLLVPIVPRD